MYYQIESVLGKYDLQDGNISKGRQVLLCEKDQNLYALKEFFGTEKKADFLFRLGEYLDENHILTDGLIKTKEGNLISEGIDGTWYTLHRWYRGRECDIKNRMEIMMAISHLAKLHMVMRSFENKATIALSIEEPLDEYGRHTRELKKIYRFVSKRKKKSQYERLFLSCFQEFFSQCMEICDKMEEKHLYLKEDSQYVCHGDYNHHNIVFVSGRPVVLHFSKAEYGLQIFDFCNFKRKIMEKYSWDERLGMAMLQEYDRICPLDKETFWQMYYRLAYPEKFWKLANRYYTSNKAWISHQSYEKLEKELRQNVYRKRYLERLLHYYEDKWEKNPF